MKTLIKNCKIVNSNFSEKDGLKDILINENIIENIGIDLPSDDCEVFDACGYYVMSGMIDLNCNICDPGFEQVEDINSISLSALQGGFTSITCQPNTKPVIDNKTVVEYIVSKAKENSVINIYPYGSMSIDCKGEELPEIGGMVEAGICAISDGDISINDAVVMKNIFLYSKMFNLPVITFCEDRGLSSKGVMNEGFTATQLGLLGIPREAEEIIVSRNIILAHSANAKLHITHVSTKGSVQIIREAKKRGCNITADTNPQYFLLTEESVGGYNPLMKVNPPLRTQEDIDGILEGIIDGTIDVIASGHSPVSYRDKDMIFDRASNGILSLETVFPLCYTNLVKTGKITLEKLIELLSVNPAKILGLDEKGSIEVGKVADLIIIDTDKEYKIDARKFKSKSKYSPFHRTEVYGKILHGVVGGKVHWDL